MTPIPDMIDGIREHLAIAAGMQMEVCLRLGDRDGAYRAKREMEALAEARRAAAWMKPCYFSERAEADARFAARIEEAGL